MDNDVKTESTESAGPKPGDLRIWYVPQVPMKAFTEPVETVAEGNRLLDVIYRLALFELENRVKPDYSNMGGVARWETDGEGGFDWYDVDEEEDEEVGP